MFTKQDLKELATYQSETSPIVSVYLNVDPTNTTSEQYRLTLRGMLRSVADKVDEQDIKAIENYIEFEYDWHGKGLALFSCGDFWREYRLEFPVQDSIHIGQQPYIKPLADYADAYDRYGVVLVDREGARLFIFDQGSLQEATGMLGEEIHGHIRDASGRGGRSGAGPGLGRSSGLDAKIDEITTQNLREVVQLTQRFYQAGQCDRIILGGTDENRARFMSMLPKMLETKVIGGLTIDMDASEAEVLDRSMSIIQKSIAERKKALVDDLITAAHKDVGSLGLSDTLMAVQEQRVQTMVIQEGFRAEGKMCTNCGYLTIKDTSECPACGEPVHDLEDMVDHLVHLAIGMDVEVVFVQDDQLATQGSIGSLWRF